MITYDHRIAVTLFGMAAGLGLQVPQGFSLIGFNDAAAPPELAKRLREIGAW